MNNALTTGMIASGVLAAMHGTAAAAVIVSSHEAQKGYFVEAECTPEFPEAHFNECTCSADVVYPQIESEDMRFEAWNEAIKEESKADMCAGVLRTDEVPENVKSPNGYSQSFDVVYQDDDVLSLLVEFWMYGAGAAHGNYSHDGHVLLLNSGKQVKLWEQLSDEQRAKANAYIHAQFKGELKDSVFESEANSDTAYLTMEDCNGCTAYFSADGWVVSFNPYAVGPYAAGYIDVTLPEAIAPAPQTLVKG